MFRIDLIDRNLFELIQWYRKSTSTTNRNYDDRCTSLLLVVIIEFINSLTSILTRTKDRIRLMTQINPIVLMLSTIIDDIAKNALCNHSVHFESLISGCQTLINVILDDNIDEEESTEIGSSIDTKVCDLVK